MKKTVSLLFPALLVLGLATGCGHLDLVAQSDPERVLTGTVEFYGPVTLPDDAVVLVRVVDAVPPQPPAQADMTTQTLKRPVPPPNLPPEVLGEQTIKHPGVPPIPFRVEYTADDEQLRRGLNVEARISYDGKVRFYNFNHYAFGSTDATDPHQVWVNEVGR